MTTNDLAQIEAATLAAKSAFAAEPSTDTRAAVLMAKTELREARWVARGGLDNPYGARSYADFLMAAREQRKTNRYVTLTYDGIAVTVHYGDWITLAEPEVTGEGDE